jgi:hypothetical protein
VFWFKYDNDYHNGRKSEFSSLYESSNGYKIHESLKGTQPQRIALDPRNSDRAYCGTYGDGLWKTDDGGQTWNNIGKEIISSPHVMSVAVSHLAYGNKFNKVYAGTEPSALYISNYIFQMMEANLGKKMEALNNLPSSTLWSFPPRPWTYHVRSIEPDANNVDYVFVAIEAGALVQVTMEVKLGWTGLSKDHMILIL